MSTKATRARRTTRTLLVILFSLVSTLMLLTTYLLAKYMPRTDGLSVELTVPDLRGTRLSDESSSVPDETLYTLVLDYRADASTAPGTVLSQDPPALSVRRAIPGRSPLLLRLTVSTGPRAVTLPSLIGTDAHQTRLMLQSQGLTVRMQSVVRNDLSPGQIVAVSPAEGTTLHEGEVVTLTRSEVTTRRTVRVPNVVGMDAASATSALVLRGLRPEGVTYEFSAEQPSGAVISQRPLSGTLVPAGSRAALVVSRGGAAEQELELETGEE